MGPRFESVKAHQREAPSRREQPGWTGARVELVRRQSRRDLIRDERKPGVANRRGVIWPVGQAVKTAASHAANMGSIPVRVTIQNFISVLVTSVIKIVGAD